MAEEMKTCPDCGGDGEQVTSHRYTCYTCHGTGKLPAGEEYDKALEDAKRRQAEWDGRLSAWEYRQMGG